MNLEIITKNLNPSQRKAVETLSGPLLILAGAGSGKTRVLTHRMANLVAQGKTLPDGILAVTFTNKAAREMESRIFKILTDLGIVVQEPMWVSTFHSVCNRLLRQHIALLDYKPFFGIYDDSDQLSQIKKVMQALNINDKVYPAKAFRNRINTAKMWALSPDQVAKSKHVFFDDKTLEVYRRYEEEMKRSNSLDFGDLLLKTYELFQMYPALLEQYQEKFRYILVDEYQDTNHIQYLLVKLLASGHQNLCVVGDEDQSIYSWRGADISNILNFEKDFPSAVTVKLEENYRSTGTIVKAATAVIKNNTERKDKTLFTSNDDGAVIEVREERNEYDEARYVVKSIQALVEQGEGQLSEFAIFYRTNAQSRVLEEQLRTSMVPYKIVGGVRFYERMEIKDIISYLKLVMNPTDDIAFKRVVNTPARGIGKTTIEKLEEFAMAKKVSLTDAVEPACEERLFNSGTISKLRHFSKLMQELRTQAPDHGLVDFYHLVLDKTDYLNKLKVEESVEAKSRVENLEELSNAMTQFTRERPDANLQTFLEEMALVSDVDSLDEELNSVTLMTLHVSKGLEYENVFVVGLEEGLFPSGMAQDEDEKGEVEEERRLAYVGMTRARKRLWLTYAKSRKVWGQEQFNQPSRFLKEIPAEFVHFSTAVTAGGFVSRFNTNNPSVSGTLESSPKYRSNFDYQEFPDYESSDSSEPNLRQGMKVRHPTFGVGSIYQVEGSGEMMKISVLFQDQTIKKFVAKYARLEQV